QRSDSEMWMRSSLAGWATCIGALRDFVAANKADDIHVRDDNETVFEHAFNRLCRSGYFFRAVDYGNHHGHVAHRMKEAFSMLVTLSAVAEYAAINSRAGYLHHAELFYDGVIEWF